MADEAGATVWLYVYDLSGGMARQFSPMILGKQIDGIWHTAIVMGNKEYFYGGSGIQCGRAGTTPFGQPVERTKVGITHLPEEVIEEYLQDIAGKFRAQDYNLLKNNCNNFTDEFARFLTGDGIPPHITGLPDDVMSTPFGQMLAPMIQQMETQMRGMTGGQGFQTYTAPDPQAVSSTSAAAPSQARADSCVSTHGGAATSTTPAAVAESPAQAPTPAAGRERLEEAIKAEFAALMAAGNVSANEAAALAVKQARDRLLSRNSAAQA